MSEGLPAPETAEGGVVVKREAKLAAWERTPPAPVLALQWSDTLQCYEPRTPADEELCAECFCRGKSIPVQASDARVAIRIDPPGNEPKTIIVLIYCRKGGRFQPFDVIDGLAITRLMGGPCPPLDGKNLPELLSLARAHNLGVLIRTDLPSIE